MKTKYLLGIAAGVGLALFFTSKRGKDLLEDLGENFNDLFSKGEEAFKNISQKAEAYKSEIKDRVNEYAN